MGFQATARVRIPTDKQIIHQYAVVTESDFYKGYEPELRRAFDLSISARDDPDSWFTCQIFLLQVIVGLSDARRTFNRYKGLIGRAMRSLRTQNAPKSRIERGENLQYRADSSLMACQWLLTRFRSIGDGLAWRLYGYDRAVLRLMAEHDHVSPPQRDSGLIAELTRLADRSKHDPQKALLHAITNTLRVGDITYFDPQTSRLIIEEVKVGLGGGNRSRRQTSHRTMMQHSLDSGVATIEGREVVRIRSEKPFKTHARILTRALGDASVNLVSSRIIEDYLGITAIAGKRIIAESPEGEWHTCTSSHIKRMLSIQKKKSDVLLPVTSNLLEIASFSRLVSPLSIRPLPPDQRYSLLSGDTILLTVLNVSGLARWFERRGWHALVVIPDTEPDLSGVGYVPGIRVEKDGKVAELPLDILTLASHELWMRESLEAVAETIVERVAMTSPGSSLGMIQVSLVNVGESALD